VGNGILLGTGGSDERWDPLWTEASRNFGSKYSVVDFNERVQEFLGVIKHCI